MASKWKLNTEREKRKGCTISTIILYRHHNHSNLHVYSVSFLLIPSVFFSFTSSSCLRPPLLPLAFPIFLLLLHLFRLSVSSTFYSFSFIFTSFTSSSLFVTSFYSFFYPLPSTFNSLFCLCSRFTLVFFPSSSISFTSSSYLCPLLAPVFYHLHLLHRLHLLCALLFIFVVVLIFSTPCISFSSTSLSPFSLRLLASPGQATRPEKNKSLLLMRNKFTRTRTAVNLNKLVPAGGDPFSLIFIFP